MRLKTGLKGVRITLLLHKGEYFWRLLMIKKTKINPGKDSTPQTRFSNGSKR